MKKIVLLLRKLKVYYKSKYDALTSTMLDLQEKPESKPEAMLQSNTDSAEWQLELERVLPMLKVHIRTDNKVIATLNCIQCLLRPSLYMKINISALSIRPFITSFCSTNVFIFFKCAMATVLLFTMSNIVLRH